MNNFSDNSYLELSSDGSALYSIDECVRDKIQIITIPNSVRNISWGAFRGCNRLISIDVANDHPYFCSVNGVLFSRDKTIMISYPPGDARTEYVIPSTVTTIKEFAFGGNKSLASITIPNNVINIERYAFIDCSSLTSITIPNSVENIEEDSFSHCVKLSYIDVDNDNLNYCSLDGVLLSRDKTKLIQYPIGNTRRVYTIPNGVIYIGEGAFSYCTSLYYISIPESVTNIGFHAFRGCLNIVFATIPNSVIEISSDAFENCKSLTSIDVANDNPNYCSLDGVLFNKSKTTLIKYPSGTTRQEYIIPNSVINIEENAFENCDSLVSITIQDNVRNIDIDAIDFTDALEKIYIPKGQKERFLQMDGLKYFDDIIDETEIINSNACVACGLTFSSNFSFCPYCGAAQGKSCSCGAINIPLDAFFCPECGSKL